ncbi:MAG: hypothetical protein LC723_05070 [Actinobacteria bacterium]|nr:hypothetical protein [Actinomycetota bacterium]
MSTRATRVTVLTFDGDVDGTNNIEAAPNAASPAAIQVQTLASGANTITVPSSTGITVTAVTIVPPVGNVIALTLKGVTGDTGIPLHLTDPSTVALASGSVNFVLTAASAIQGVRLFWS